MMLCATTVQARPGQGGRPQGQYPQGGRPEFKRPEVLPDSVFAANRTARMVEKYGLSEEQEAQVSALNLEYAPQLQMRMPEMERPEGGMPDFRSMSDAERQQMMAKMQERMAQMQEMQEQRDKAQKAFDKAMKQILDKDQYKAYTKDRKKEQRKQESRQGGFGGPGGGFGGPGGGGFGGPGGGFGGDF